MSDLEPLSRTIHATAIAALTDSLTLTLRDLAWPPQLQFPRITPEELRGLSLRADGLRLAIDYHTQCYNLCPSVDD